MVNVAMMVIGASGTLVAQRVIRDRRPSGPPHPPTDARR
jgi:hypothetical protein